MTLVEIIILVAIAVIVLAILLAVFKFLIFLIPVAVVAVVIIWLYYKLTGKKTNKELNFYWQKHKDENFPSSGRKEARDVTTKDVDDNN